MKTLNFDKLTMIIPSEFITINERYFEKTIKPDNQTKYCLDKSFATQTLGINSIKLNRESAYISITGKLMADKGYLGYITKNNFCNVIDRLNNSNLLKIKVIEPKDIQVLACDVTEDIFVSNIDKSILGISEYIQLYSNLYRVFKYDTSGILIATHAKKCHDSLVIYNKYKELKSYKNRQYINNIGYETLIKCQNILRIERHLSNFNAIRKAFEINHKGKIYLDEIFESDINPLDKKFKQLKLTEEIFNVI